MNTRWVLPYGGLAVVLVTACVHGTSATDRVEPPEAPVQAWSANDDAAATMSAMEAALLSAEGLVAQCEITSTGAVTSSTHATLEFGPGSHLALKISGTMEAAPADNTLSSDGKTTTLFRHAANPEADPEAELVPDRVPTPPHLRQALAFGLSRMGLLHNVAMLAGGQLPDHASGGVESWVETTDHHWQEVEGLSEPALAFSIVVDGGVPATAHVQLSPKGWPTYRYQEVQFPSGVMVVEERCTWSE